MPTPLAPETPSVDTFGGTFRDADGVVDPETELAAAYYNNLAAQVVALGHTAPRAWARVTVAAGVATLADHSAVWGDTGAVAPAVARSSAGVFTVTWAAAYDDLRAEGAESHPVQFRAALASVFQAGAAMMVSVRVSAPNVLAVTVYDATGTPDDPDEFTVTGL